VAADAGRPLRAGGFAAAAGLPTAKAKVEGLRSKLRLLAERGRLAPAPGGLFAISQAMFAALAVGAGPAAAGMTAFELEELVGERGREVLLRLLQDHYDLRGMREEQQARANPAPVTGPDGITRTRLETGRGRALATLVRHGDDHPVRLAETRSAELAPGGRGPVPAGRAALPYPGEAGRDRGGPRLLRRRPRGHHPPLRAGHRQAADRGIRRARRRRHPRLLRCPRPAAVHVIDALVPNAG